MKSLLASLTNNWSCVTIFLWIVTSNQGVSFIVSPLSKTTSRNRTQLLRQLASLPRAGSTELYAAPLLKDFSADADQYFRSIRDPASFLAGASLGALFILAPKISEEDVPKGERYVRIIYHLLMMMVYNFSMATVLVSTAADVTIMHGGFNPMATSAYELLKREFEFEYLSVRWSFLMSSFAFLGGVTSRGVLEFGLLKKERRRPLWFVLLSLIGLVSHWISYVNQTLYCWPNLMAMTWSYFKVNNGGTILFTDVCFCSHRSECCSIHDSKICSICFCLSQ